MNKIRGSENRGIFTAKNCILNFRYPNLVHKNALISSQWYQNLKVNFLELDNTCNYVLTPSIRAQLPQIEVITCIYIDLEYVLTGIKE